jgi:hypothetical protein
VRGVINSAGYLKSIYNGNLDVGYPPVEMGRNTGV